MVTTVSTVENEGASEGNRSEANAAATRNRAEGGILTESDATAQAV
jgi:hypothetical protein